MQRSRSEYSLINILTGFGGYFVNTVMGYISRIPWCKWAFYEYSYNAFFGRVGNRWGNWICFI